MTIKKIKKIAIANRGEIAVRIIHAAHELGLKTVLLHSEVDTQTLAYRLSDETVCLGQPELSESYLHISKNIKAACKAGAEALHPGFGFLSENPRLAQACKQHGLIFIGPSARAMKKLGDKIQSKLLADKMHVPTIPGYWGKKQDVQTLVREVKKIGVPVMVKASGGGGGRGLKVIHTLKEAPAIIESAQREAWSSFGSTTLFLEKFLDHAKHVEFQIFADSLGHAVHLYERECSVQRRHQKIIEESPCVSLKESMRQLMASDALKLIREVGYEGAGTVEFLVQDNQYYFLEVNTRLQVEHPVTEMVMGCDLVKEQIHVALGKPLSWKQEQLHPRGYAIECRLYAENPYEKGLPQIGTLGSLSLPFGPHRRFDMGFEKGDVVSEFYDSMIGKVIVWDENRTQGLHKMSDVISNTIIFGLRTNIDFLKAILQHPEFKKTTMTTAFIQRYFPHGLEKKKLSAFQETLAQKAYSLVENTNQDSSHCAQSASKASWIELWRNA